MNLKVNDTVILSPVATISDTASTPHFGGKHGRVYGTVQKVITNDHDATFHRAVVKWDNGHTWNHSENDLILVDLNNPPRVSPKDGIYLFLRPNKTFGGLRIGMVSEDFDPELASSHKTSWVSISTKSPIPDKVTEEELLSKLATHTPIYFTHDTKLEAVNQILMSSGFPEVPESEISQVPIFRTMQDARDSEGDCRERGYLLFTLPE